MKPPIVTNHAKQRIKERVGLSKKISEKLAIKALEKGIKHKDAKGALKTFITQQYLKYKNGNNIRIYAEKVFIFKNQKLITVFHLPNEYKKYLKIPNRP